MISLISQLDVYRIQCIQLSIQLTFLSLLILKLSLGKETTISRERSPEEKLRIQFLHLMSQQNSRDNSSETYYNEWNEMSLSSLETLLHTVEGDPLLKKLVTLDLSLRQLARLEEGDRCDPSTQPLLDNPPPTPTPPEIISWQLSLLSSSASAPLCNYLNHLHCSRDSRTCVCRDGLVPQRNTPCLIPVGANCGSDFYFRHLYFDPLLSSKVLVEQPFPSCTPGFLCTHRPLFFRKKCWCNTQRINQSNSCNEKVIFTQKSEYLRLQHGIQGLFTLTRGQPCDPEFQEQILNPPEYELIDTRARVLYLEQVLNYPLRLCNLQLHLNCSEVSRRCECWSTTDQGNVGYATEGEACVGNRGLTCGITSLEASFYDGGPTVFELGKVFIKDKDLQVHCIDGTHCQGDPSGHERCVCKSNSFGPKCLYPSSNLTLDLLRPKLFDPSICSTEINNIFDQVNAKMVLLEQRLRLDFNSPCDVMQDYKVDIILTFWKKLSSYWGLGDDAQKIENLITLQVFLDIRDMATEILEEFPEVEFCDRKKGFCCNEKSMRCRCPKGTTRQNSTCRIIAGHPCDMGQGHWSLPCVNNANCVSRDDMSTMGTCKCIVQGTSIDTLEKERAICDKPDTEDHNAVNESTKKQQKGTPRSTSTLQTTNQNQSHEVGKDKDIVRRNLTISLPSVPPSQFRIKEIHKLLLELSEHRLANLDEPCIVEDNEKFTSIMQIFSSQILLHGLSAVEVESSYHQLQTLLRKGNHFCDGQNHLICSSLSAMCECKERMTLDPNSHCRLTRGEQCSTTSVQNHIRNEVFLPLPKCLEGLSCTLDTTTGWTLCLTNSFHQLTFEERRLGAQAPDTSTFKSNFLSFCYILTVQFLAVFIVA